MISFLKIHSHLSALLFATVALSTGSVEAQQQSSGENRLQLTNGDLIKGTILSINEEAQVSIRSAHSSQPLIFKQEAISSANFSNPDSVSTDHSVLVTLVSGETLPGDIISMDEENLSLSCNWGSNISIPRKFISTLDLNIAHNRTVYEGPKKTDAWTNPEHLKIRRGSLSFTKESSSFLDIGLPKQRYILSFNLAWNNHPSISVGFNANKSSKRGNNYYEFLARPRGIELRRILGSGSPIILAKVPYPNSLLEESRARIEIRCDRNKRQFQLFINNVLQGSYRDPTSNAPSAGSGIIVSGSPNQKNRTRISGIIASEWDQKGRKKSTMRILDSSLEVDGKKFDSIIVNEGEQHIGEILGIEQDDEGSANIIFKSKGATKPLNIPTQRVSQAYLYANAENDPQTEDGRKSVLYFAGTGEIHSSKFMLSAGLSSIEHPLLGRVSIKKSSLISISQLTDPDNNE